MLVVPGARIGMVVRCSEERPRPSPPLPSTNNPQELQEERRVLRAEIAAEQAESEQSRLQVTFGVLLSDGRGLVDQAGTLSSTRAAMKKRRR